MRAMILVALIVFQFDGVARADDFPKLPSRKASVVLPLLAQVSPKDNSRKEVLAAAVGILGNWEMGIGRGTKERFRESYYFILDDGTQVAVTGIGQQYWITVRQPGQPLTTIYPNARH